MQHNIGEIYWLTTEGTITHPHVLVKLKQNDLVVVCSITTNRKKLTMPGNVFLNIGEGNLEKESIVEVSKEFTINKSDLKDCVGILSQERVKEILAGIRFIHKSFLNSKGIREE